MIEVVFALILELNGKMIEHVYKDSLQACLYSKRVAKQEVNPERVVFKCKKVEAETEVYQDRKRIIKMNKKKRKNFKKYRGQGK
jgi:hypothetical protein